VIQEQLSGVWVAMVTPWDEVNNSPRKEVMAQLINRFVQAGVDGLFVLGTTGEGSLLSVEERKSFLEITMTMAEGKLPVIVHVGHDRTRIVRELAVHAKDSNVMAVAVSPPVQYVLTKSALKMHFIRIAETLGDFPMVLYDHPVSVNPLNTDVLISVNESAANLIGAKVSRSDWQAWEEYLAVADKITLLTGVDSLCLPLLFLGARGIISGLANIFPEMYVRLYRAVRDGDIREASRWQNLIKRLCAICNSGPSIQMIKTALKVLGFDVGACLTPCDTLSEEKERRLYIQLVSILEEFGGNKSDLERGWEPKRLE